MRQPRTQPTTWRTLVAWIFLEGLFFFLLSYSQVQAETGLFGFGSRTLGGRMVFADEVVHQGWRIQKHALIGHYRLLEPDDNLHSRGSFQHCLETLEKIKVAQQLPPLSQEVVVVLHGLGAYRHFMNPLVEYLTSEGKLAVVNVGYPSTFGNIGDHAQSLASIIRHLEGVKKVHFVAHSMGNIVIRHYLKDLAALPAAEQPQVRYGRLVMLAPPNHGAQAADKFANHKLANLLAGEAVKQLAPSEGWVTLEPKLATPDFEFGILVGGTGDDEGYLEAIPGDDDMLLSVATSKLAGASDFVQVPGIHQTMPKEKQVQQYTLRFLQTGAFLPSGRRYPITATAAATSPR